ncbi:glycosyl hydrolase family 28 [Mangrovibacterium marinum]|uniref:Glycosyl hydrolase family 28 n=1 Tax=Mangrovibacterium marinum TaxID=1639118 RepID=A0A2T5C4R3_9BACT|nr:glycosyl hydrolase family 28 protein [Mangrovibacterium marinum]PTN09852.1 glycosyl hydrolase family 28 [Mangrovibacterium marinum]
MKRLTRLTVKSVVGLLAIALVAFSSCQEKKATSSNTFPDGTPIPEWFSDTTKIDPSTLGKWYSIADYGAVADDLSLNTEVIQQLIDTVSATGGGVIVVPQGTFRSGALFFKPGTHLHIQKGGMLKGSDDISNYPIMPSRMEGQNLDYYPALVNAYDVDGFTITGEGTIDGNGLKYWEAFWQRRKENPKCTNLEVSRPRLVFIWGCDNVQLQDVKLHNSGFWTTHLYQCNYAKLLDLHIFAPKAPVPAPSSDALDLDVCSNVLVRGCYMSVNDDAIAMKGGKGPWADEDPNNGPNENILIENNTYGFCHSTFTCGSESVHTKNVLVRNCTVKDVSRVIFLKMRPDTPQKYEYITLEGISGTARTAIYIRPWRQFFDLQGRETPPVSSSENITFRDFNLKCDKFAEVGITQYDRLSDIRFEDMTIEAGSADLDTSIISNLVVKNVTVNGEPFLQ